MSKLLGISLAATIATVVIGSTAVAGHWWGGCSTPRYYHQPGYQYYQPGYQYHQPGYQYQQPVAPAPGTQAQVPGTQTYRGFSYEPDAAGTVTPAPAAPSISPGYQPTYTPPRQAAQPSRPSYLDATSKIRGRFGR